MWKFLAAAVAVTSVVFGAATTARAADDVIKIETVNISNSPVDGMRGAHLRRSEWPVQLRLEDRQVVGG